ncbi:MAG: winged helix-turn-helix domain-containing protein [Pseudomonadota bacterium]
MQLTLDGWQIDLTSRTATRNAQSKVLSPRAVRLLEALVAAKGEMISREDLLARVWPNVFVSDESLTQVVAELRRTLENSQVIATIPRGGYKLAVPLSMPDAGVGSDLRHTAVAPEAAHRFDLGTYALCIEARDCFSRAPEGVHRTFVDLSAEAVKSGPDCPEARALYATALLKRHIYLSEGAMLLEETIEEAETALALDPCSAEAYLALGSALIANNLTEPGLQSIARALSYAMDDATVHLDAAIVLLSLGETRAATALALKASRLAPEQFGADLLLSRVLLTTDPYRARIFAHKTLGKVRQTLLTDPHSMRALYALGPLLAQLGEVQAAHEALEGIAHHDSALEYYRAVGFAQIGDSSSAMERLNFLAMRGWRHACILDKDDGFRPMLSDPRFRSFQQELIAA